jgi:phosphinothricin acetyltransferase
VLAAHEWLVLERAGELLGLCVRGRFRERAAYRQATESTIYLRHGLEGKGFGAPLYSRADPAHVRSAAIATWSARSRCRTSRRCGCTSGSDSCTPVTSSGSARKFDRWIDVGNWQLERASD